MYTYYILLLISEWLGKSFMIVIFVTPANIKKRFRRFGFLRKPSSVMIHTHRLYCINTGWMTDGDRSCEVEVRQTARTSITIPYIYRLSQSICRVLSHLDIRVTFHPFRTLRQELVHPKDPVPELQRKGVVYTIPCDQCPRCYVGQTGRSLEQRLGGHHRALRKGMCWPLQLWNMCLHQATRWTCPRPGLPTDIDCPFILYLYSSACVCASSLMKAFVGSRNI